MVRLGVGRWGLHKMTPEKPREVRGPNPRPQFHHKSVAPSLSHHSSWGDWAWPVQWGEPPFIGPVGLTASGLWWNCGRGLGPRTSQTVRLGFSGVILCKLQRPKGPGQWTGGMGVQGRCFRPEKKWPQKQNCAKKHLVWPCKACGFGQKKSGLRQQNWPDKAFGLALKRNWPTWPLASKTWPEEQNWTTKKSDSSKIC